MKNKISDDTWSQVKGKYVAGKTTITQIAKDHKISRKSIERRASKEGWEFGSSKDEVSKAIEIATIETIVKKTSQNAIEETIKFLKDYEKIRALTMGIVTGMSNALKISGGNIPADEANRLLACQRTNEVSMRTITTGYTSARKALGLDVEADIEKAKKIKGAEKQPIVDPCENLDEEQLDEEIKRLEE